MLYSIENIYCFLRLHKFEPEKEDVFLNTTQLECFTEVANFLNFSRAAEHLRITQPAVSHQINTLEDELGVKLFLRTSKSVRLTQEGYQFMQYAGEILKLTRLSKARMKESWQAAPLRLVIGCRNAAELRFLSPALERLRQERPEVLPVLRLIPFDSVENLLAEGDVHLIFSFRESNLPKARYRELVQCPVVCVCSDTHPLAVRSSVSAEDLRHAGRIATCRPPSYPAPLFAVQSQVIGNRETREILFCDHQEVLFSLVETGYAFAVTSDIPNARIPGLTYIPMPEYSPLSFGAVYLSGGNNRLLREFLTMLEESLQPAAEQGE